METGETIKKGFLRLERDAQNISGGFHCCAEDPENGYPFAYVSDRFLEILGWEREEFAARFDNRYTALIHPDDLAAGLRYRNAENSATYAKNGDSIFRLLGKNGYRWVTNAANRVEWHGSGHIVGTITDITPYVELRKKLEQHQRKIGVPQCQLPRKGELFCFCRSAPESDQPGEAFQAVPRSKKAAAQKVQRLCGVSHHSQRSEMIHQIPGRLIRPSRCSNTISMVFSFQTVRFSRTDPSAKTEAA